MTAVPGVGALPELGGVVGADGAEPDEPPFDDEEDAPCLSPPNCWAKGSLDAKRLKFASWPSCRAAVPEAASESVLVAAAPAGAGAAPWRVGAARVGVPAGGVPVGVDLAEATGVAGGWSFFHVFGP